MPENRIATFMTVHCQLAVNVNETKMFQFENQESKKKFNSFSSDASTTLSLVVLTCRAIYINEATNGPSLGLMNMIMFNNLSNLFNDIKTRTSCTCAKTN